MFTLRGEEGLGKSKQEQTGGGREELSGQNVRILKDFKKVKFQP